MIHFFLMSAFAATSASNTESKSSTSLAVDGLLQTAWVGDMENAWYELKLSSSTEIKTLSIWPGNLENGNRSYKQYARPKLIHIEVDGTPVGKSVRLLDEVQRLDVELNTSGRNIRIVVEEIFDGIVYPSSLAIAEVAINFSDSPQNPRVENWANSKTGLKTKENFDTQLNTAFANCVEAEFGDKEAFTLLGNAAADGAPYYQDKVQGLVSEGYRIQALPSDPLAIKALNQLKNPNAIPYLELAMLRAQGTQQRQLKSDMEYMVAFSELKGGRNRNVKFWGEEGWALGEIRSFDEPIPLEINRLGEIYVADIGNNRIQLFNEEGRAIRYWGGNEPGITNEWFVKGQPWYVSGAEPGRKSNQFVNPVDVVLLPEKEADGFATLEANGRVQLFDSEGRGLISWTASPSYDPEPKLGGTAYLAYLPKHDYICTILQDEGICFNRDAEELTRWEIKDGTPNAVEVLPNDKILMAFGDEIVSYAFDGFRERTIIDENILGPGFESLDMTLDENNKLWVFTDRGDAFKFKRPGKLEYKIDATDKPVQFPRIAVIEDILYISTYNHIEVVDLRQRKIDLEDAQK